MAAALLAGCGGSVRIANYPNAVNTASYDLTDQSVTVLATDDALPG
jgi:hypothetical protein